MRENPAWTAYCIFVCVGKWATQQAHTTLCRMRGGPWLVLLHHAHSQCKRASVSFGRFFGLFITYNWDLGCAINTVRGKFTITCTTTKNISSSHLYAGCASPASVARASVCVGMQHIATRRISSLRLLYRVIYSISCVEPRPLGKIMREKRADWRVHLRAFDNWLIWLDYVTYNCMYRWPAAELDLLHRVVYTYTQTH